MDLTMELTTIAFAALLGVIVLVISGMMVYGAITCWEAGSRIVPFVFMLFIVIVLAAYIMTAIGVFS